MRLLYGTKASFARMTGDCQRQRITCPTTCRRGVVRARTLWGSIATARGPMHDILLWLLSSPFISVPLLLSFHHPVIVPFGLVQRHPVNCGSWNCGTWSRNTCFRTSASSVPVLSYCTCPGLRCLTSLLHCYAPARLFLRVTRPIPHRLPPLLPRFGSNFFRS